MTATHHRWGSTSGSIDGYRVGRSYGNGPGWVFDREPKSAPVEPSSAPEVASYRGEAGVVLLPAVAVAAMREPAVSDETTLVLIRAKLLTM